MIVSKDESHDLLAKYFPKLLKSILDGNAEIQKELPPKLRAEARKRTFSTLINDIITHNLRKNLNDCPGIRFSEKYDQLKVIFPEGFLMKCKQSKHKRLSFIDTQLMFDFMHQLQLEFPGMRLPYTNLALAFQLNRTRTAVEKVDLLCPADERRYHWDIPFEISPEPRPQMEMPETPELPPETKRITPKPKRIKKTRKGKVNKKVNKDEQQGKENQPRDDSSG